MAFGRYVTEGAEYQSECPYCFAKFSHDRVIFRAKGGYEEKKETVSSRPGKMSFANSNPFGGGLTDLMDVDEMGVEEGDSFALSEAKLQKLFRKFDPEKSSKINPKLDHALIDFWNGRGGEEGYKTEDPEWNLPHIDPASDDFDMMVVREPGSDGFLRDPDGFIYRVVDSYTRNQDLGMTRLCPACHNPLPGFDYGKYPVFFISVVGLTSAGKTVFIRQMLNTIEKALETTQYVLGSNMIHSIGDEISPSVPLPGSTDTTIMRRPISVTICDKENTSEGITLVFYDIAGENCEMKGRESEEKKKMTKKVSEFLAHTDGMILLMDPDHLSFFGGSSADANMGKIKDVLNIISTHRTAEGMSISWKGVPVAICVTKSDRLDNRYPDLHLSEGSNPNADGFDNEGENLNLHKFMKEKFGQTQLGAAFRAFDDCAYFAVSAISCDVETRVKKYSNVYALDQKSADLFRRTRKWFMGGDGDKGWNELSEEDRKHRGSFPIRDRNNELITFPYNKTVEEKDAKMETEIVATCPYDTIHLTLWDVLKDMNPVGYPTGEAHPWRIHEPLKWILWRMGYIGPKFREIPPEPPTFAERTPFGRRKYLEYLEVHKAENQEARKEHYWGRVPEWDAD